MNNFRTYTNAVEFYKLCKTICLPYHLREQLNRAASSIALNLAEGRGRSSKKDQLRFFQIAMGSVRECQALLQLAPVVDPQLVKLLDKLAAYNYKLIKSMG